MKCPCGSDQSLSECCEPYLKGERVAPTAEALMRARYTAYTQQNIDFLKSTLSTESQKDFDEAGAKTWAATAKWKKLEILNTEQGTAKDKKGSVEFVATYEAEGQGLEHHEVSQFRKNAKGEWRFVDGEAHSHKEGEGHQHHHTQQTVVNESPKIGRNDPCPCGSGKKYKKCCAQ